MHRLPPTIAVAFCIFNALNTSHPVFAQDDRTTVSRNDLPRLKDIYKAAPLKPLGPETPMSRQFHHMLSAYLPYIHANLKDWPNEPGAKYHKRDGSQELAVRQNATVAFGLAVMATKNDAGRPEREASADATALVKYLAVTHLANFLPTGDGKPWGNHWQSAFWAALAGKAAWMLWGSLDDETKIMAARMIIHEADRYNQRPPDDGEWLDTKAEENAWNSNIIVLAACMFPNHPHARLWRQQANVYMMNSFSTKADHSDATVVDGRAVKDWVITTCIHQDYTLENHARVHPDYMGTIGLLLTNAIVYKQSGTPIPDAVFHNVENCFRTLTLLTSTNGSYFYINGQDWWPHRHDVPLMVGGLMGTIKHNRQGAFMEKAAVSMLNKMRTRFSDGRAFDPKEYNYANVEEELIARYAELYLAHRLFGDCPNPSSSKEFLKQVSGAHIFNAGGFVIHRTREKFASFAWVNGAMGLVFPSEDTWFTSPDVRSLLGTIQVEGVKDPAPKVLQQDATLLNPAAGGGEGFVFCGMFGRCEDKVVQNSVMISLPGAPILYMERLKAKADIVVGDVSTGTLAVLNENANPIARNQRRVWTAEGESTLVGESKNPALTHVWETPWINVDEKLMVVAQASGKMSWQENHTYANSRLQQILAANCLENVGAKKAGDTISMAVIGILPGRYHSPPALKTERSGEITAALFEGWVAAVNFGETKKQIKIFGVDFTLPPLRAQVKRAPKR